MSRPLAALCVLGCLGGLLPAVRGNSCRPTAECAEDRHCPDIPEHADREHGDVFGNECDTVVSELWSGPKSRSEAELEAMTAKQLKAILQEMGLDIKGRKQTLIGRVLAAGASGPSTSMPLRELCPCSCDAMAKCAAEPPPAPPPPQTPAEPPPPPPKGAFEHIERIELGKDKKAARAKFAKYFEERRPVIITDAISAKTRREWGMKAQQRKHKDKRVIATTQPSGWEDTRHTNFHAIHQYIETNTEIGVSWGPVLEALAVPAAAGKRPAAIASKLRGSEFWRAPKHRARLVDWASDELYLRSNLPSDHDGDDLGPALEKIMAVPSLIIDALHAGGAPSPRPLLPVPTRLDGAAAEPVARIWAGHLPTRRFPADNRTAILRGGSAGTYYPAHFDCFPNLLQQFTGEKTVFIFDQRRAWREFEAVENSYHQLLSLLNIHETAEAMHNGNETLMSYTEFMKDKLFRADLHPGDTLFIPPMYLHEVLITEGSLGVNSFFEAFNFPDTRACTEMKMKHPMSWKVTADVNAFLRGHGVPE